MDWLGMTLAASLDTNWTNYTDSHELFFVFSGWENLTRLSRSEAFGLIDTNYTNYTDSHEFFPF